jgi:hypothetical protein
MSHQFSMLWIMNAALVSVGLDEIVSDEDGTPEFRAMARNWPGIVEAELEAGRYEFGRRQADLESRIDGKFGMPDGYLIPGDALAVRNVWTLTAGGARLFSTDWVSDGEAVYLCATDGCTIDYLTAPDPSFWSANFSNGVQAKLEAVLYRAESDDTAAREADARAEMAFQTARTVAAKERAARPLMRNSVFAQARFSRGSA